MNTEEIKERVKKILENHALAVIATVDEIHNKPEAAVIAFAEKEDFCIVFGTSNQSRKYKNLQINQHVSFAIGWNKKTGALQYEGIARELSTEEAIDYGKIMMLKNNKTGKFIAKEDQRYFLVRPTWIRLITSSAEAAGPYEIHF